MDTLTRVFPVLERLKKEPGEKVEIVSSTIVEEVLQDIGIIDFKPYVSKGERCPLARPGRPPSAHR